MKSANVRYYELLLKWIRSTDTLAI